MFFLAGCIPVILSYDFVWPLTKSFDAHLDWDPNDFSITLNASDYNEPLLNQTTCQPFNAKKPSLQALLETIPSSEIQPLCQGVRKAANVYSWYEFSPDLPKVLATLKTTDSGKITSSTQFR